MALMGPVEKGVLDGEFDAATLEEGLPDDDPPAVVLDPASGDVLVPDWGIGVTREAPEVLDSCEFPGDVVELSMLLTGVVVVDTTPAASVVVDVPLPLF